MEYRGLDRTPPEPPDRWWAEYGFTLYKVVSDLFINSEKNTSLL